MKEHARKTLAERLAKKKKNDQKYLNLSIPTSCLVGLNGFLWIYQTNVLFALRRQSYYIALSVIIIGVFWLLIIIER